MHCKDTENSTRKSPVNIDFLLKKLLGSPGGQSLMALRKAENLEKEGHYNGALEEYEKAAKGSLDKKETIRAISGKITCLEALDRNEEALTYCETFFNHYKDASVACRSAIYFKKIYLEHKLERFAESNHSIKEFSQITQKLPFHIRVIQIANHINLGKLGAAKVDLQWCFLSVKEQKKQLDAEHMECRKEEQCLAFLQRMAAGEGFEIVKVKIGQKDISFSCTLKQQTKEEEGMPSDTIETLQHPLLQTALSKDQNVSPDQASVSKVEAKPSQPGYKASRAL